MAGRQWGPQRLKLVLAVVCFGCGEKPSELDARDAGRGDASVPVVSERRDAGVSNLLDSGVTDSGAQPRLDAGSTVDASVTLDAGVSAVNDGGCPANALFCDSFESPQLDLAQWTLKGQPATFVIDDVTPAPEGARSLHVRYGLPYAQTGIQVIQVKPPIRVSDDRVFLRAYMRFETLTLPGAHPFFVDVVDSAGTEVGFGSIINDFASVAYAPNGLDNARIWYEGGGGWHPGNEDGDTTPNVENRLNAKSWFCLEMMFFGDHQGPQDTQHPNEELKVWINGTEMLQMAASDQIWRSELGRSPPEHWSPVYDQAQWRFGVESFGPRRVALDFWFDAIVIAPTRIGCLP
jgi:hypothetical protein